MEFKNDQYTLDHMQDLDPFETEVVQHLFDEMSSSYDRVNRITSFGFANRWRQACLRLLDLQPGEAVLDLMCGGGECLSIMAPRLTRSKEKIHSTRNVTPDGRQRAQITAIDFSKGMIQIAERQRDRLLGAYDLSIQVCEGDVLQAEQNRSIKPAAFDALVCAYGLKTMQTDQLQSLVQTMLYALKPGGRFAFVEISVPRALLLRWPYMFYLKFMIPWLGRLLLGNPDNYARLGFYTEQFQDCSEMLAIMQKTGLRDVQMLRWFGGCATALRGTKDKLDAKILF